MNKEYTYKELSKIGDVKINTISQRVSRLRIKGFFNSKSEIILNKYQAERVLNYNNLSKKNHPVKIKAVELHLSGFSIKKICKVTNIKIDYASKYINEYRFTKEIIVESSLNLNYIEL